MVFDRCDDVLAFERVVLAAVLATTEVVVATAGESETAVVGTTAALRAAVVAPTRVSRRRGDVARDCDVALVALIVEIRADRGVARVGRKPSPTDVPHAASTAKARNPT